jgi:membrane associated rhomboid family serine protease
MSESVWSKTILVALLRLFICLYVFPFLLVGVHLHAVASSHQTLFVYIQRKESGEAIGVDRETRKNIYGTSPSIGGDNGVDDAVITGVYDYVQEGLFVWRESQHIKSSSWTRFSWPDIISNRFTSPRDGFSITDISSVVSPTRLSRSRDSSEWCLYAGRDWKKVACHEGSAVVGEYIDTDTVSGAVDTSSQNDKIRIQIQYISSFDRWRHGSASSPFGYRTTIKLKPWQRMLLEKPATLFWMGINIGLAFVYWNRRIAVSSVAKVYSKMMHDGEIWRGLSGATAHFETWHLFFNMQALYSLGSELESNDGSTKYSSVTFFMYTASLVLWTTIFWLLLETLKRRFESAMSPVASGDSPTVGFSGVLFAWMVVASLEQSQTCPVHFLPSLCFVTHEFVGFRFNFAPLVQLGIAQVLLPRVSLTGHLAGILSGLALHWGLLPLAYTQPAVLLPTLYAMYLKFVCPTTQVFSTRLGSNDTSDRVARFSHQWGLKIVLAMSSWTFGVMNALTICFGLVVGYGHWNSGKLPKDIRVVKGWMITVVLACLLDAMSVAGWTLLVPGASRLPAAIAPTSVMVIRWVAFMTSLAGAACHLTPTGSTGDSGDEANTSGIFDMVLGWTVVQPATVLAHAWSRDRVLPTGVFAGPGQALGGVSCSTELASSTRPTRWGGQGYRLGAKVDDRNHDTELSVVL